jgi:hypothetical protein
MPTWTPGVPARVRGDGVSVLRTVHPAWRWVYPPFLALTAASTVILFAVATETDDTFAWTVQPAVSAAFLGAGYASGFVLIALTTRVRVWAGARIALVTVFAFVLCTLATTLAHLDRFHFGRGGLAGAAAWLWLVVYLVVPVGMGVAFWLQRGVPGDDPPVRHPLPTALTVLLGVQAVVLVVVGAAILVDPERVAGGWPWVLTPLTGRAVGAWCLPLGLAAALAVRERDAWRLRAAAVTYVVLGVLHATVLVRFRDDIAWDRWGTWAYLAVLASMVVAGTWGWALGVGAAPPGAGADRPASTAGGTVGA